MWGADAATAFPKADGIVIIFAAVDRCVADWVGIHGVESVTGGDQVRYSVLNYDILH